MKTLLITGSEGFIGSHLVKHLNDRYKIIHFDKVIGKDLRFKEEIEEVFKKYKIDCVVHLAGYAGVRPSIEKPLIYLDDNVRSTMNLLEVMKEYHCNKIVFASSSSVYGNNFLNKPSSETDTKNPISPYAYTKSTIEDMLKLYHETFGMDSISTRFFTVYGPNQRKDLAISKFIKAIKEDSEIHVYGDGTQSRDYTYIDDIVNGLERSIKLVIKNNICECINLCSSKPISVNKLLDKLFEISGKEVKIIYEDNKIGDVNLTYGNNKKAKELLHWSPKVSINEGLKLQYFSNQK